MQETADVYKVALIALLRGRYIAIWRSGYGRDGRTRLQIDLRIAIGVAETAHYFAYDGEWISHTRIRVTAAQILDYD